MGGAEGEKSFLFLGRGPGMWSGGLNLSHALLAEEDLGLSAQGPCNCSLLDQDV